MRIGVVGCGFVGSVFMTEFLKRCYAGKLPADFTLVDYDTVETRNSANQNFLPTDAGTPKATVMQDLAIRSGYSADAIVKKVDADNIDEILKDCDVIVDGVDNLATRQLLWGYGLRTKKPVCHVGISEQGTGKVEWSYPDHDTFSLSPIHTVGKTIVDPASGVTPPCELARMRGVGLNVGFATAVAVGIFYGFDPESHLKGVETNDYLTEWGATPMGYHPMDKTWEKINAEVA